MKASNSRRPKKKRKNQKLKVPSIPERKKHPSHLDTATHLS